MFHVRIYLKSVLLLLINASKFCVWVQVGTDVSIPHSKYQAKTHPSPWLSAAFAAATVQRNHVFPLHQQNKSSESKVKFKQASNRCKNVLGAAKFEYAVVFSI